MRWNVEGADATTGKDRLVTVEADDARQAEVAARMKGLLVAAVHPVRVLSPVEKLDQMMAGKFDASTVTSTRLVEESTDAAATVIANARETPPVSIEPSRPLAIKFADERAVPRYIYLRFSSFLLGLLALISIGAGLAGLTLAFLAFNSGGTSVNFRLISITPLVSAMIGLACIVGGVVLFALSSACAAIREIARKSSTYSKN